MVGADERIMRDLERSSIMYADTADYDSTDHEEDNSHANVGIPIDVGEADGHKGNCGSSKCHQWTVREKLEFVDEVMQAIDDRSASSATNYFRDVKKCQPAEVECLRNNFCKWSCDSVYRTMLAARSVGVGQSVNVKIKRRNAQSPFHEIENQLYTEFVDIRKKVQKVSSKWFRVQAQKIFCQKQVENPEKWGGGGYFQGFIWLDEKVHKV